MSAAPVAARVRENRPLGAGLHEIIIEGPLAADTYRPGQFLMLLGWRTLDPLLARPFSIAARHGADGLSIVLKVTGRGSALLAAARPGHEVTVTGPLGRAFTVERGRFLGVAGGIGIAPFPLLAEAIRATGGTLTVAYGARTARDLVLADRLEALGCPVVRVSEAGDLPLTGLVPDHAARLVREGPPYDRLYACGPEAMLDPVCRLAEGARIPCEVSLERTMACGVGICYSCVVWCRTSDGSPGYRRTCLDGPVMDASRLAGLPWRTPR